MKQVLTIPLLTLLPLTVVAQEALPKRNRHLSTYIVQASSSKINGLKLSGYLQVQNEWGEPDATLRVGSPNEREGQSFSRFGIRRGRLKVGYESHATSLVIQTDITEKEISLKEAYLKFVPKMFRGGGAQLGVFKRPFGYEVGVSSSERETPERALIIRTLLPDERDLGAMLLFKTNTKRILLNLKAGLFSGNAINMDTDSRKDFIGQLSISPQLSRDIAFNLGASLYWGSVYQGSSKVYRMQGKSFVLSDQASNQGAFASRNYFGLDGQIKVKTILGETELRSEYLKGQQPGSKGSSRSPNSSQLSKEDTYIRPFSGGYALVTHSIKDIPLSAVVKYDWYDPNTGVSGDDIGQGGTGATDITYRALGFGLIWDINKATRLQAYYEIIQNEVTSSLADWSKDRRDNSLTLRLQYKF